MSDEDLDPEALISRLSAPLSSLVRAAFRRAAEAVLAELPCTGPGSAYRALAALQRIYFDPPDASRTQWQGAQQARGKPANGPPIGKSDDGSRARLKLKG